MCFHRTTITRGNTDTIPARKRCTHSCTSTSLRECLDTGLGDTTHISQVTPIALVEEISGDTISQATPIALDEDEETHCSQTKKPKRVRNPELILKTQREKHPIRPPCACKKACITSISQIEREKIHDLFWSMDRQRRRDYLLRQVHKKPTVIKTRGLESRRQCTLSYALDDIKVCKIFFLNTLGFSNDEAVHAVLNKEPTTAVNPKVRATPDPRGRHTPSNAFSAEYELEMKNFILQYKPVPSHYRISHAPNRKYLPIGITFTSIYKDFQQHCLDKCLKVCSWTHFHNMIQKLNLSTCEPPQDICSKCRNHEQKHKTLPAPCNCNDCIDLDQHLKNKRDSRRDLKIIEEKVDKSDGQEALYTVDMQKVICMPLLTTKEYFFSRKLVLYNETFVPPGTNKQAVCIVWHEGESGRKAHNVATTYIFFSENTAGTKHMLPSF